MYEINDRAVAWIPSSEIEEGALKQIDMVSQMPFVFRHVAVMPDCHRRHGRNRGLCDPNRWCDHSGGSRRGHWLRNDRGEDAAEA